MDGKGTKHCDIILSAYYVAICLRLNYVCDIVLKDRFHKYLREECISPDEACIVIRSTLSRGVYSYSL